MGTKPMQNEQARNEQLPGGISVNERAYKELRAKFQKLAAKGLLTPQIMFDFTISRFLLNVEDEEVDQTVQTEKLTRKLKLAFSPITNKVKLANGRKPYDTLRGLLNDGKVSDELDPYISGAVRDQIKLVRRSILVELAI